MNKKFKVFMACWATVIVLVIIVSFFLVLFGMRDKIESYFYFLFSIEAVVIFILFWPFYWKRLE